MGSSIRKRFEQHSHWPETERVLKTLAKAGYQAVLAGGCVRDALLGRPLNDFDVATDATPDQVEDLFERSLSIGKAFGVIKVIGKNCETDVATFRADGEYKDGRHPETVEFSTLAEDARRRDFTINALFYSYSEDKIIDVVGGRRDLQNRIIRAVGKAEERFDEDSLRALRAIRFASQLGFNIEGETWHAIEEHSTRLSRLAKERQMEELRKLSTSDFSPAGWELLRVSGVLQEIFPELSREVQSGLPVWRKALNALASGRGWPLPVSLGWFGYSFELEKVEDWLGALKASAEERATAAAVETNLKILMDSNSKLADRLLALNSDFGPWLLKLWPLASLDHALSEDQAGVINSTVEQFKVLMDPSGHLQKPLVTGKDLLGVGIPGGPELGAILGKIYALQLEGEITTKTGLVERARRMAKK